MYGLILQNMVEYIKNVHGEKAWTKVKEQLQLEQVISIKLIVVYN